MTNPFKYGREVSGYQFYDRREAGELLHRRLAGGASDVVMYAPRRYGKTSLALKVLDQFRQEGVPGLCFDMARVPTIERFCEEYANAVFSLMGGGKELVHKVMDYLVHLHPRFSVTGEISLDYGSRMSATSISEVLDLPERLAEESGVDYVIVAFDEFQEVAELSTTFPLEKIFRSCIQAHKHVRYVFFGSKTHLLKRMFADHARPFYESAQAMRLEKPPRDESIAFLVSHFSDAGIAVARADAEAIVDAADNIPYYIQAIAAEMFDRVSARTNHVILPTDLNDACAGLIGDNQEFYSERLHRLSASQSQLIYALSREPTACFGDEYRQRHNLPVSSTLHSALKELVDEGLVDKADDVYQTADPLLCRFLKASAAKVFSSKKNERN